MISFSISFRFVLWFGFFRWANWGNNKRLLHQLSKYCLWAVCARPKRTRKFMIESHAISRFDIISLFKSYCHVNSSSFNWSHYRKISSDYASLRTSNCLSLTSPMFRVVHRRNLTRWCANYRRRKSKLHLASSGPFNFILRFFFRHQFWGTQKNSIKSILAFSATIKLFSASFFELLARNSREKLWWIAILLCMTFRIEQKWSEEEFALECLMMTNPVPFALMKILKSHCDTSNPDGNESSVELVWRRRQSGCLRAIIERLPSVITSNI